MKIKKSTLMLIIIIVSLFIFVFNTQIANTKKKTKMANTEKEIKQITLTNLPFSFSDIKIYDPPDKLYDVYRNVEVNREGHHIAESKEFTCQVYNNRFSLLSIDDTYVTYKFYDNKLIHKSYSIIFGGKLFNYLIDNLTAEFGHPEEFAKTEDNKIPTRRKWTIDDYIIEVISFNSPGNGFSPRLTITFSIKDSILVELADNKLMSKLKNIETLRFDKICTFYNDYSIGRIDGNWALIDQNSREVLLYKSFDVYDYSYAQYGLLILKGKHVRSIDNRKFYRFVDINGKVLIDNVHHYKRSHDGNTIVAESYIKKDGGRFQKSDIISIDDGTYNVVYTDFRNIGYFSKDGYAIADRNNLIDRQGKIIHQYSYENGIGYYNGSSLHSENSNYDALGNKLDAIIVDKNKRKTNLPYGTIEIFEKFGLLETWVYKERTLTERIIQNSKGDIVYKDDTYPFTNSRVIHGVIKLTNNNKSIFYDHKGTLIKGVTQYMIIPTNAYFRDANRFSTVGERPYSVFIHNMDFNGHFDSSSEFCYAYLKIKKGDPLDSYNGLNHAFSEDYDLYFDKGFYDSNKGDRLYSYSGLHHVFPEDYELYFDKCFYDFDNILIVAKNRKLEKYGVIDINGNIVFDFKYNDIQNIVASNIIQIGDTLLDINDNIVSEGLSAIAYKYNSAIKKDSLGFYVLDLKGEPIIDTVKIIE